jgi:hypothetical protein
MEETIPAGAAVNQGRTTRTEADAATQLLQGGMLDDEVFESRSDTSHIKENEEIEEKEVSEDDTEESEEEQPEGESDEETDTEQEDVEEPLYVVKVSNKNQTVNLGELKDGYQRGADYTQKTQELSRERKEFENDRFAVSQERQQYQQALGQFREILAEQHKPFENIDWQELLEVDPTTYVSKKEEQRDLRDRHAQVQAEQQRIHMMQQQEGERQRQALLLDEGAKMVKDFPDWEVPEKRTKLSQGWVDYAISQGYSSDDVNAITDHRAFRVLDKAMKYDKIMNASTKKGKITQVPKTMRPGTTSNTNVSKGKLKSKMQQLKRSGSIDDAASAVFDML